MRRPYTDMPRQDRDSVPGRFMGTVVFVRATMIGDHLQKSADPKNRVPVKTEV